MVGPVPADPRSTAIRMTAVLTDRVPRIEATTVRRVRVDPDLIEMTDRLVGNGVRVRSQPVGTTNGAPVPLPVRVRDQAPGRGPDFLRAGMMGFAGMTDRVAISDLAGMTDRAPFSDPVAMMARVEMTDRVRRIEATTVRVPISDRVGMTAPVPTSAPAATTDRAGSFRLADLGHRVDRIPGARGARDHGASLTAARVLRLSVLVRVDPEWSMVVRVAGTGSTDPEDLCRARNRDGRIGQSSRQNPRLRPPGWNWPNEFLPRLLRPFRLICSCGKPCPGASN